MSTDWTHSVTDCLARDSDKTTPPPPRSLPVSHTNAASRPRVVVVVATSRASDQIHQSSPPRNETTTAARHRPLGYLNSYTPLVVLLLSDTHSPSSDFGLMAYISRGLFLPRNHSVHNKPMCVIIINSYAGDNNNDDYYSCRIVVVSAKNRLQPAR